MSLEISLKTQIFLHSCACNCLRYVKNGRQGQLVERCRRPGAVELTEKLSEHPSLSWVQAGLTGEYRSAANTLHSLARNEIELVRRKKVCAIYFFRPFDRVPLKLFNSSSQLLFSQTMLSLAKLAILASNEADDELAEDMKIINNELKLIEHQEDVSEAVLETYGYDTNKMRVLSAVELITVVEEIFQPFTKAFQTTFFISFIYFFIYFFFPQFLTE